LCQLEKPALNSIRTRDLSMPTSPHLNLRMRGRSQGHSPGNT
jgi:hypothetical protein